jgi:large subunit ribosomal protein L15
MNLGAIPSLPGSRHRRKRVGRGIGSGHGKTSTRGQKGQRARTGSGKHPGFEGGRNPLIRRIPKRGFRRKATGRVPKTEVVNLHQLNRFTEGERVTPELLRERHLISDASRPVKLLGEGALTKKITIVVHRASESAAAKVKQAGGAVELIDNLKDAQGSELRAQGKTARPSAPGSEPRA